MFSLLFTHYSDLNFIIVYLEILVQKRVFCELYIASEGLSSLFTLGQSVASHDCHWHGYQLKEELE